MAVMMPLPRERWTTCTRCGGTGEFERERDLHRSGGNEPCGCHGGLVTYALVSYEEYRARLAAGTWPRGDGQGTGR